MTVGMVFAAMAFVSAALVQIEIDVSVKSVNQIQVQKKPSQAPQPNDLILLRKHCQTSHHPLRAS